MFSGDARGRWRVLPTRANAHPAMAFYQREPGTGVYRAFAVQVLTFDDELVADITTFGYPALFRHFGLPLQLKA
jgi:RNA polymerase sigma-70 factor (ECF subfamily)